MTPFLPWFSQPVDKWAHPSIGCLMNDCCRVRVQGLTMTAVDQPRILTIYEPPLTISTVAMINH